MKTIATVLAVLLGAAAAYGGEPGESGPPLETSPQTLDAALEHHPAEQPTAREPVLLVHGTGSTPDESWGWSYLPVLHSRGFDVFTVALPERALADIQISSQYVVHAIRTIARATGRKVQVIGHSQGGVEPRWALQYWPDLRDLVDDVVTLCTPRDGTLLANIACLGGCGAAVWQVAYRSNLVEALNAGDPTPGDVSYTSVLTRSDEVAFPGVGLGAGPNVSDVFVQDLCPGRPADHISMIADAVAFAVVLDALEHAGPFDPARFDPATCLEVTMPGVPPTALLTDGYPAAIRAARAIAEAPRTAAEPPVRDYAH